MKTTIASLILAASTGAAKLVAQTIADRVLYDTNQRRIIREVKMKSNLFGILISATIFSSVLSLPTSPARADILDNWTTNQVSTNPFYLLFVVHANGRLVAFGGYSDWGVIMTSEDGNMWTLRSDGAGYAGGPGSGLSYSTGLVYTGGRFFALGGFGSSAVSSDGTNWTVFTGPGGQTRGVAYDGSKYVAVGTDFGFSNYGQVFTSSNGTNWTLQYSVPSSTEKLADVAYGAGRFVAIGENSGHVYTSTNGTNWAQYSIPGGKSISYRSGLFIVPSGPGTNLLSGNGVDWAASNTGITNTLEKMILVNGLFMARAGNYLATSVDMFNWTQYSRALPGYSLACDGSRLMTVGNPIYLQPLVYTSDVLVGIRLTNTLPAEVVLSGLVGRSYRIEYSDALAVSGTTNWNTLVTLQLPNNPYSFTDSTATNSDHRFYRGVLLP